MANDAPASGMPRPSEEARPTEARPEGVPGLAGAQTLHRGLAVLSAVGDGAFTLAAIAARVGLARSTAHRLASALVEERFLQLSSAGYRLGPALLALGARAREQRPLVALARPHIEALADETGDTVHLGERSGFLAVYLDKVPGRRRVEIRSFVGDLQPLVSTGLGKALILDATEAEWRAVHAAGRQSRTGGRSPEPPLPPAEAEAAWIARMRDYAAEGVAFDLEENEDRIRCIAAPIRDASGAIAAAVSLSSAAQYLGDARMAELTPRLAATAAAIGAELGWRG